ncbi:hypothetical protein JCM10207_006208 [Rhodosporidiobolus poonsookiae]
MDIRDLLINDKDAPRRSASPEHERSSRDYRAERETGPVYHSGRLPAQPSAASLAAFSPNHGYSSGEPSNQPARSQRSQGGTNPANAFASFMFRLRKDTATASGIEVCHNLRSALNTAFAHSYRLKYPDDATKSDAYRVRLRALITDQCKALSGVDLDAHQSNRVVDNIRTALHEAGYGEAAVQHSIGHRTARIYGLNRSAWIRANNPQSRSF